MRKIILIGIDGGSFSMLCEFADNGVMPALKLLQKNSVFKRMMASIPDNSAVSWTSIITGCNPGEHGIFGFTDLIPDTYTIRFPNFFSLKAKPFWLKNPEKKYIILNVPFTYPVKELNGQIVSGFVSPDMNRAVYPESLMCYLEESNYKIDVDTQKIYKSRDLFLDELFTVHSNRVKVYRNLFKEHEWDVFKIVFTGTDRLQHYMMDCFVDKVEPYNEKFIEYFSKIDNEISWIIDNSSDDDIIFIMSDHGMERSKAEVYVNTYLEEKGFLKFEGENKKLTGISDKSQAFALDPSRIYLNYAGKYPRGKVRTKDSDKILNELTAAFKELKYNEERVIESVHKREEIYHGYQLDIAPDLVLVSNLGFDLRGAPGKEKVFAEDSIITGMHRGSDAFLCVRADGAEKAVSENPAVEDILTIMNSLGE